MGARDAFESLGVRVKTTSEAMGNRADIKVLNMNSKFPVKPLLFVDRGTEEAAIKCGLIPESYRGNQFSMDQINNNIEKQKKIPRGREFEVMELDRYEKATLGIISTIRSGKLPEQSFLIGAPNGFGKTSFVNTCILLLYKQGRLCAPYISLSELAMVRLHEQKSLIEGISPSKYYRGVDYTATNIEQYREMLYNDIDAADYSKTPINIISKYSWSEYMNCDVLFCYLTDIASKALESEMLKTVLTIRGAKGLSTIVTMSTSLLPYTKSTYSLEYVWNEILADGDSKALDRVKHISCYKSYFGTSSV